MTLAAIQEFLAQPHMAIAGVSADSRKFGNVIYKELTSKGFSIKQIHPSCTELNGAACVKSVSELPMPIDALIIVTKPENTLPIVQDALAAGIRYFWFQQGSFHADAVKLATEAGATVICKKCILMFADPVNSIHKFHRGLAKLFLTYPN